MPLACDLMDPVRASRLGEGVRGGRGSALELILQANFADHVFHLDLSTLQPRIRTLWYMGVKTRILPAVTSAIESLAPAGSTVLDLFAGTGAVGAALAKTHRIVAHDSQTFAKVVNEARLVHNAVVKRQMAEDRSVIQDLGEAYDRHISMVSEHLREPLLRESEFIRLWSATTKRSAVRLPTSEDVRDYAEFVANTPLFEETVDSVPPNAVPLLTRGEVLRRRSNPWQPPFTLTAAYYTNVYFGVRQAIELDGLRFAIESLDRRDPLRPQKRCHYLSALVHAASVATSGTGTFVQPRALNSGRNVRDVLTRRAMPIAREFMEFSSMIWRSVMKTRLHPENAVTSGDWRALFRHGGNGGWSWAGPGAPPQVVYADPPYTSDQYSRFYHVLEVLVRYDYPALELGRDGRCTKGRYPTLDARFRSRFCEAAHVEAEMRDLVEACSGIGAALVLSYSRDGLLLKEYMKDGLSRDAALERFLGLARSCYTHVECRELSLTHSGQGDSSRAATEILVTCRSRSSP